MSIWERSNVVQRIVSWWINKLGIHKTRRILNKLMQQGKRYGPHYIEILEERRNLLVKEATGNIEIQI